MVLFGLMVALLSRVRMDIICRKAFLAERFREVLYAKAETAYC